MLRQRVRGFKDPRGRVLFFPQIVISGDLGYIESATLDEIKAEIQAVERMLKALIKSLENKPWNP